MNWSRFTLGILLLALLGSTPVHADNTPVTLSRTFKKGDVVRINVETTTVGPNGADAQIKLTSSSTVKDVKDNGDVVIETQDQPGKLTINGNDMDIPGGQLTTLTFDTTGKLVDFKSDPGGILAPETSRQLEIMRMPILPDKAVVAGDSWQSTFDNPAVKGNKFTVRTTFVGMDKVDGANLWKLSQAGAPQTDANGAKMGFDATYWLDPASGQLVKSEIKITDEPTTRFGTHSLTTKTTLIKPE
ncbi:MAG TPA: hypothetical protein VFJ58_20585 [Armatimonadota bacterium]|nr:hypothetical protein [Armatimonadota bacterium]